MIYWKIAMVSTVVQSSNDVKVISVLVDGFEIIVAGENAETNGPHFSVVWNLMDTR